MGEVRYLIVNADDLGLFAGVAQGIVQACRFGIVSSTTLMVNLSGVRRALRVVAPLMASGQLGVGLHFNLTLGRPVSTPQQVPSLVDEGGNFCLDPPHLSTVAEAGEIERELEAQLNLFRLLVGYPPTHLDSHKHLHRSPRLLAILGRVAAPLGLPVRSTNQQMRAYLRRHAVLTTDAFVGQVTRQPYWTVTRLVATLPALPAGTTELMCHPALTKVQDSGEGLTVYYHQRQVELEGLCDPDVRQVLTRERIRLINFRERQRLGASPPPPGPRYTVPGGC